MSISKEKGMTYINGYDHPHIIGKLHCADQNNANLNTIFIIIAGQGSIGLEIIEQIKDVDAIVVPIGGGGLIAGIAVAAKSLKKDIQIIVSISSHLHYKVNYQQLRQINITVPTILLKFCSM